MSTQVVTVKNVDENYRASSFTRLPLELIRQIIEKYVFSLSHAWPQCLKLRLVDCMAHYATFARTIWQALFSTYLVDFSSPDHLKHPRKAARVVKEKVYAPGLCSQNLIVSRIHETTRRLLETVASDFPAISGDRIDEIKRRVWDNLSEVCAGHLGSKRVQQLLSRPGAGPGHLPPHLEVVDTEIAALCTGEPQIFIRFVPPSLELEKSEIFGNFFSAATILDQRDIVSFLLGPWPKPIDYWAFWRCLHSKGVRSAFEMAFQLNCVNVINLFMEKIIPDTIPDSVLSMAVYNAVKNGNTDMMVSLLKDHGHIHASLALLSASGQGHVTMVRQLLRSGADANSTDNGQRTALFNASVSGHTEIMALLLAEGALMNVPIQYFGSALHAATKFMKVQAVKMLLDHGADIELPSAVSSKTPLHFAAGRFYDESIGDRCIEIIRALVAAGANIDSLSGGCTPLADAAYYGNMTAAQLLLELGADPILHFNGKSPLWMAAREGNDDIVRLLLDLGLDANGADQNGTWVADMSPIEVARINGKETVVQLLLERGATHHALFSRMG